MKITIIILNFIAFCILSLGNLMIGNYGALSAMPVLFIGWLVFIILYVAMIILENKSEKYKLLSALIAIQIVSAIIFSLIAFSSFD